MGLRRDTSHRQNIYASGSGRTDGPCTRMSLRDCGGQGMRGPCVHLGLGLLAQGHSFHLIVIVSDGVVIRMDWAQGAFVVTANASRLCLAGRILRAAIAAARAVRRALRRRHQLWTEVSVGRSEKLSGVCRVAVAASQRLGCKREKALFAMYHSHATTTS